MRATRSTSGHANFSIEGKGRRQYRVQARVGKNAVQRTLSNLEDIKGLAKHTPGIAGNSKDSCIDTLSIRGIVTDDFGVGDDPSVGLQLSWEF